MSESLGWKLLSRSDNWGETFWVPCVLFFLQQNVLKIIYTPTATRQVPSTFCHERRNIKLLLHTNAYHGIHAQLEHSKCWGCWQSLTGKQADAAIPSFCWKNASKSILRTITATSPLETHCPDLRLDVTFCTMVNIYYRDNCLKILGMLTNYTSFETSKSLVSIYGVCFTI